MTYKGAAGLAVLILLIQLLGWQFGREAEVYALAALFLCVAALQLWRDGLVGRLLSSFQRMEPETQAQQLTYLENTQLRVEIVDALAIVPPRVPLRGGRERFSYPPSVGGVMRIMTALSFFTLVLIIAATVADPVTNAVTLDALAGYAFFVAALGYFGYSAWNFPQVIEVTDQHLALYSRGKLQKLIPWTEVRSARKHPIGGHIAVKGKGQTVRFSYIIEGYDRLLNLVQDRAGDSWRAA